MEKQDYPLSSTGIKVRYFDGDAWGQDEIRVAIDMSVMMEPGPKEEADRREDDTEVLKD